MSELTKEYFEQYLDSKMGEMVTKAELKEQVAKLATKGDLKSLATKEDLKPLVTRKEFENGLENLAIMVSEGFDDITRRLDVRKKVSHLETDVGKIKSALRLT